MTARVSDAPPPPSLPEPATPPTWSVWVLTVWHPEVGLPVDPVAVLAVDTAADGAPATYLSWVPRTYHRADPWRERLAEGVTPEHLARWQDEEGVCAMAPGMVAPDAVDLRHAAEIVMDGLLAEVIPYLPTAETRA
ncbi:MAG: hypothetical protein HOV68_05330 [Streptomycetaceae bacterium]|nr:hypothetical protein [Streptomycetaceae bacterium]